jgi:hypothetical protein
METVRAYLVDVLVGTGSTKSVKTELLVGISLPAHGGHNLNRHRWDTIWEDAESVLLWLSIENLEARNGNNTSSQVVLLLEDLDSVNTDANLGTSGYEGDIGILWVVHCVATLGGTLNGGVLQVWKVLAGERDDGWGALGGQGNVVSSAGLVSISWAPDHAVGESTEMGQGLDRLMGCSILAKTNGVVSSDPDGTDVREGRKTDGTGGV